MSPRNEISPYTRYIRAYKHISDVAINRIGFTGPRSAITVRCRFHPKTLHRPPNEHIYPESGTCIVFTTEFNADWLRHRMRTTLICAPRAAQTSRRCRNFSPICCVSNSINHIVYIHSTHTSIYLQNRFREALKLRTAKPMVLCFGVTKF